MKILFVANTDWYVYNFRRSFAQLLLSKGFEVFFASPGGAYVERLEQMGCRWVRWDVGRKTIAPFGEMIAINQLARIYAQIKPDLVHHFTIKPVLYGSWAARSLGVPRIVNSITGRGYIFLTKDWRVQLLRPLTRLSYRLALSNPACQVIFENEDDHQYFLQGKLVGEKQSRVIASVGVDIRRFQPSPQPEGVPLVVFPARILWDKGVGVLVKAARLLRGRVAARFVLVGKPDPGNPTSVDEVTLQGWVNEGLVESWGWHDDMNAVYQQSHIVTLPSMYEGVPTALLEGAACGRPLVGTDISGCRAIIKEGLNGFLVPLNDPAALANALEKLILDKDLRQRMGAAGRKLTEEQFSDSLVNARTFEVYQTLLD